MAFKRNGRLQGVQNVGGYSLHIILRTNALKQDDEFIYGNDGLIDGLENSVQAFLAVSGRPTMSSTWGDFERVLAAELM